MNFNKILHMHLYIYMIYIYPITFCFSLFFNRVRALDLCTKCVSPRYLTNKWLHFEKILLVLLTKFKMHTSGRVSWELKLLLSYDINMTEILLKGHWINNTILQVEIDRGKEFLEKLSALAESLTNEAAHRHVVKCLAGLVNKWKNGKGIYNYCLNRKSNKLSPLERPESRAP